MDRPSHSGYRAARWIVTVPYVLALVFSALLAMDTYRPGVVPFPFAALAITASYGVLMLLLWLHERLPPPK